MSLRGVSDDVVQAILELFQSGATSRGIVQILKDRYGVETNYDTIQKYYRASDNDRATMTSLLVQQTMGQHVRNDLDTLNRIRQAVHSMTRKVVNGEVEPELASLWYAGKRLEADIVNMRLRHAALLPQNDSVGQIAEAGARLHSRMARLIARVGQNEVAQGSTTH